MSDKKASLCTRRDGTVADLPSPRFAVKLLLPSESCGH